MFTRRARMAGVVLAAMALLTGCSNLISGTPTWPGAKLEKVLLSESDFPAGVQYTRMREVPGQPDNMGGSPPMLSLQWGCSVGPTDVITDTPAPGPGPPGNSTDP